MARLVFGGGVSDWTFAVDSTTSAAILVGGVQITFWDQRAGGVQYTDLQNSSGSTITTVTTSTGLDGLALGQIPLFYGPDGVFEMWAEAAGGPRALLSASNLGTYLGPVKAQLDAHVSPAVQNPHGTTLASLPDVAGMASKTTGQVLAVSSDGLVRPTTVVGLSGQVTVADVQTVSGTKTFENQGTPGSARVVVNAAEAQTVDVFQVWSGADAGTGGVKVKTTSFNARGEARFTAAKGDSVAVKLAAQTNQTANLFEQTTSGGTTVAWMAQNGTWRAPNLGRSLMFTRNGTLTTGVGTFMWTNDLGVAVTIRSVRASVGTAPTGAAVIADVNVSGTTIFGTPGNRPTIAVSATTSGKVTAMSVAVVPDGGTVTVDIDQVGSILAGADLTVQVEVA
jgi:hypothetical protein